MMQILFLSTWFPYPADNGSKIRVKYLLQALAREHEITLLSFAFATAQPDWADELPVKDVETVPIDPFVTNQTGELRRFISPSPVIYRPIAEMQQLTERIMAHTRFDVVIASTELMATYALQGQKSAVKVLEEHNSLARKMRERYQGSHGLKAIRYWLSWQKMRRYERQLFKHFDLVTMVSEEDMETSRQLLRQPGTILALVSNGVDCGQNQPGIALKKPRQLIFNGSLTYQANYEAMDFFLAKIYPAIRAQMSDVNLVITGSNAGIDLANLALNDSVTLSGNVDDIRQLVAESAACVVPLRQGGGTRLKILEAMSLGTPVIATSKGAEGLRAEDGEHLLIADDPQIFADKVVALLDDSHMQQQLSGKAREFVEDQYEWREIGARFAALVENSVTSAVAE